MYGYTWTIVLIFIICGFFLFHFRGKYNIKKLLAVNLACLFSGFIQIWSLECLGNVPAWSFYDKTCSGITLFQHIVIEDLFFIIGCTTLFYWFNFIVKKIPDVLRKKHLLHYLTIFGILGTIQWLYATGGTGARDLIVVYAMAPLVLFLHFVSRFKIKLNYTAMYVLLAFVAVVGVGWDVLNVTLLKHWFYNIDCNLLSKRGFFFNDLLHTSISIGYSIAGFITFFSTDTIVEYFTTRKSRNVIYKD